MSKNKCLMIVCHPDDEVLWGSKILENKKVCDVIVLTNSSNVVRKNKFFKILEIFNQKGVILDFTDSGKKWESYEVDKINKKLVDLINKEDYSMVITHNPDGEYGHVCHIQLSEIITSIVDKSKLFYFTFEYPRNNLSKKALKAISEYFGNYLGQYYFFKFLNGCLKFILKLKYSNKLLTIFRLDKVINYVKNRLTDFTHIYQHVELSKHQSIIKKQDYKLQLELIKKINKLPYVLYNKSDVYKYYEELYRTYPSREYLSKTFLPSCESNTLSVGCHHFNKWDHLLIKNPKLYHTIDSDSKYQEFGSPYNHTVEDFLDYKPDLMFFNIILFGVLGIPLEATGFEKYTLFENEEKMIQKTDEILEIGGYVLFGPDYVIDQSIDGKKKWKTFFTTNNILKNKYELTDYLVGKCNLIYVFKKLR